MNINTIKNFTAVVAVAFVTFFAGALSAHAAVTWADGSVSFGNSAGVGQCSLVSVGNHTTQEGVLSGSANEPCWATSISAVQPGQEFALLVKYKNIGNETASNVSVRVTPNGASTAVSSKTFSVTVSGQTPGGSLSTKTDSVTVNIAQSAQTITLTQVDHYPAPYTGATGSINQSTLFGSGASVTSVGPNQYGYVRVRFVVSNTQAPQVQAPTVTTNNPTIAQSTVTFKGNCVANNASTNTWFEYRKVGLASSLTASINRGTACGNFSDTRTLTAGNYEYRAMAQNSAGSDQGSWIPFTIQAQQQGQAPSVTTNNPAVVQTTVTFNGSCVSNGLATSAWFEFQQIGGTNTSVYSTNSSNYGTTCGNFSDTQTLAAGNYRYQAVAANSAGTTRGSFKNFTIPANVPNPNGILDVATNSATSVSANSATLNGVMNDNGAGSASGRFIYASDDMNRTNYVADVNFTCSSNNSFISSTSSAIYGDNQTFSRSVSGLVTNSRYKFRACAVDSANATDQGVIERFTTQQGNVVASGILNVLTQQETNVDSDSATLNGYVSDDGAGNVSAWFVYGADNINSNDFISDVNLTCTSNNSNAQVATISGTQSTGNSFAKNITGLQSNLAYKFRACGRDSNNTLDQGAIERFVTDDANDNDNDNNDDGDDGIKTLSASSITQNSAYLNGTIDQGDNFDDVWFVMSRTDSTPECDTDDDYQVSGSDWDEGDDFEKKVTGLNNDTKYYFRACAERNGDEFEGSVKNFTTDDTSVTPVYDGGVDPVSSVTIQTLPTTSVTQTSAVVNGVYNAGGCTDLRTYFLIGTTPYNMTTQSGLVQRGNSSGVAREEFGNLVAGVSYYTQFVGICNGKIYNGDIKSFTTTGVKIQTPVKVAAPTVITKPQNTGNSCLNLMITNDLETVSPGSPVTYRVNWENTCDQDLDSAILSIEFPKEFAFATTSEGQYAGNTERKVIMELDRINKDDDDFAIITGTISRSAQIGELVVVQADFGARGDAMNQNISATAFDVDQVATVNTLGAFALGAGIFGGPWGWLIALIIIALIVLLARALYMAGAKDQQRRGAYAPVYAAAGHPQYPGAMYHSMPTGPVMAVPHSTPMQAPVDPNAYTLYRPAPPTA